MTSHRTAINLIAFTGETAVPEKAILSIRTQEVIENNHSCSLNYPPNPAETLQNYCKTSPIPVIFRQKTAFLAAFTPASRSLREIFGFVPTTTASPDSYTKSTPEMNLADVDLKQTINLPRTNFSMKASLSEAEPRMLARWAQEDLYGQVRKSREGKPVWILHDGPPYANGRIHLGTAFNKIIKDFIVKSKTMAGFDSPYVPGWDCHGLPIEHKVDQELGAKKAQMSAASIRRACRKYAEKWVNLQREDFKRLGVLGRWDDPYLTMEPVYQSVIARAFVDFLHEGYAYKGLKPVNWCIQDKTALAEAEVEYADHKSPSVWVEFPLVSDPADLDPALAGLQVAGLIWTTTPWTLPANLGISFNPKYEYAAVRVDDTVYIVAAGLLEATTKSCHWQNPEVVALIPGHRLDRTVFRHSFINRLSLGMLGDHVTLEQGTGAVHTAPGHGQEDYVIGMQYGLPVYCPVDPAGRFYAAEGADGQLPPQLLGKTVWEGNDIVLDILKSNGTLAAMEPLSHSYPHCWRCHNPTIFRATEQWFIGMDRNSLRQRALDAIHGVKWQPEWGDDRISNMVSTRPDWCISRQRVWGVPIVIFYCAGCREPLTDHAVLNGVCDLFAQHSADIWFERSAADLIPPGTACAKCGSTEFVKENDILDVWFDSGSSHLAVLTEDNGLRWPADMYLEGGDQYRGWFQSSLLIAVGLRGAAPYRGTATHGWALDGEGKAMHKSLGNDIPPEDIIKQSGAELIRLWSASVDFMEDVRVSPLILTRLTEAYRKLRNTFRYALGNIHDFKPATDAVPGDQLLEIDQWILVRAEDLVARCRASYDEFAFHKVYRAVYDFAAIELSSIYFDVLKDRLYTSATRSHARRSAQTALYRLSLALVRIMAPILSFTMEEVWGHLGQPGSVHTAYFPDAAELTEGISAPHRKRAGNWTRLIEVRDVALKSLETARQEKFIGAPLEARVILSAPADLYPLLLEYASELPGLFIVSEVELTEGPAVTATIQPAHGAKCDRCWKYTKDRGSDPELPTVCASCAATVRETLSYV
jgi:isoleucyl-tRNA synthetase